MKRNGGRKDKMEKARIMRKRIKHVKKGRGRSNKTDDRKQ